MSKIDRELKNYFSVVADLAAGAEEWEARPAWLEFAPNNLCNLRCIMCAQADGLPLEVMPKEAAIALLDEVLPHTSLWTPSALSEPMLANIKLVLQKCREHEVWLNMYSNCTILNGVRFREIGDRVHKLWISFDSPDREVLETLRAGADFDQVVRNIREILEVAKEKGIPVGFVAVLVKDNVERIAALVDFVADLGAVDARCDLRVQPMLDNAVRCRDQNVFAAYSEAEIEKHIDRAVERAKARGLIFHVDMDEPLRRSVSPQPEMLRGIVPDVLTVLIDDIRRRFAHFCYMGATYMKIEPNGTVFPCCRGPRELAMGNVNDNTVTEIWNSERYRDFRRRMHERDYPEVCRTCDHLVANPHFKKEWLEQDARAR